MVGESSTHNRVPLKRRKEQKKCWGENCAEAAEKSSNSKRREKHGKRFNKFPVQHIRVSERRGENIGGNFSFLRDISLQNFFIVFLSTSLMGFLGSLEEGKKGFLYKLCAKV